MFEASSCLRGFQGQGWRGGVGSGEDEHLIGDIVLM